MAERPHHRPELASRSLNTADDGLQRSTLDVDDLRCSTSD